MIECDVNNVSKSFGDDLIFEGISFSVKTGERIGLIGPNGCGKTTLMKMIMGVEHIPTGSITFKKGLKVGYLDQIPEFEENVVVEDVLQDAFAEVYLLKKYIDELLRSMESSSETELERVYNQYNQAIHEYEMLDGYLTETNINKVCSGLQISDDMRTMKFALLSGGEKTRVMLAKILLEQPELLLLDEPSNHLDLDSIEWLEGYLKEYRGSVLVVSHDRYFLDRVVTKIVDLSTYKAHVFHGNYSYYLIEKERRFLLELKVYLAQERKIKRMETQIERYRIWGRMRDSDKMFKRAKELEKRLEKIERLDKPIKDNPKMKMDASSVKRSGKIVLEAHHIDKSFDQQVLLEDAFIEIRFQDRLAILGANGSGKTTLIKMLLEDVQLDETKYKWGSRLHIGYLPQEVVFEDSTQSVLDYFMNENQVSQNDARRELAKALFVRDDVFKQIGHLSGGEKSKLLLCSLTYQKANFLILDEPTNHLDIDSREILEELLMEFEGSILFISHDRYFIQKIANRIGEIEARKLQYYECDYQYYRFLKQQQKQENSLEKTSVVYNKTKKKNIDYSKQIRDIEQKLDEVESQIVEHAFDSQTLQTLYLEKEKLEEEYLELLQQEEQNNPTTD